MNIEDFFKNINPDALNLGGGANAKKISNIWRAFMEQLTQNPEIWLAAVRQGQQKQLEIMTQLQTPNAAPAVAPEKGDRRFAADQWRQNPFFSFLMQNYLVNGALLRDMVESADLPEEDKKILRFTVGQYVDAMSPSNFPGTNPEVVEEAIKTGGESLIDGMKNMAEDMKSGAVKNTDLSAFVVGDNLAATPGKIVLQTPLMQLIEYAPQTPAVRARPLLIVPPCINKYYILDLTDKKSLVAHLLREGHRVFLISWVNAGDDVATAGWDDYLRDGVMAAIQAVTAITRQEKINTLGFCVGGTLLASALAALAANDEHPAQSLTLLATMLDFSDTGEIGLFIDEDSVAERERRFADGGLLDGRELARGFAVLRPNDLIWPYVVDNYYKGKNPPPFDLLFWNADSTNLPGRMFAEYLRKTYLENQISNGRAQMCGVDIVPAKIRAPVYAVACEKDHIVPWHTAYLSAKMISAQTRFVLAASGHIAGIINPPAANKRWYLCGNGKLPATAAAWKESSTHCEGSWWNDWFAWLNKRGGKKITAPKRAGNVRYPPLQDAPGDYATAPRPPVKASDFPPADASPH